MNSEHLFQQSKCVAHEIRNHLSICELYSQIIQKNLEKNGIENQSIENALCCIKKSLKIMSNNLLDLKSLGDLQLDKYDLSDVMNQAISLSEVYIADKKIIIASDFKTNVIVKIDENKFIACLVNIIKNAIEAIKNVGEIRISCKLNNEFAQIQISNNGEAITKSKQIEIFQDGFTTKSYGSGLGLFICKHNLEQQNANFSLIKSDTKETVFEILLPIVK